MFYALSPCLTLSWPRLRALLPHVSAVITGLALKVAPLCQVFYALSLSHTLLPLLRALLPPLLPSHVSAVFTGLALWVALLCSMFYTHSLPVSLSVLRALNPSSTTASASMFTVWLLMSLYSASPLCLPLSSPHAAALFGALRLLPLHTSTIVSCLGRIHRSALDDVALRCYKFRLPLSLFLAR